MMFGNKIKDKMRSFIIATFISLLILICLGNHSILIVQANHCKFIFLPQQTNSGINEEDNTTFLYCQTQANQIQQQWTFCIDYCCSGCKTAQYPSSYPQPQVAALDYCTIEKETDIFTVLGFIAIAAASLVAVSCLLRVVCKHFSNRDNRTAHNTARIENYDREIQLNSFSRDNQRIWTKAKKEVGFFQDEQCVICLQPHCSVQLSCKHIYHSLCIGTWLQRNHFCPLCHRQNIEFFRFFCWKCRQYYLIIKQNQFLINFSRLKDVRCENCIDSLKKADADVSSTSICQQQAFSKYEQGSIQSLPPS